MIVFSYVFRIIMSAICISAIVSVFRCMAHENKHYKKVRENFDCISFKPFLVSDYYDRMEKLQLSLQAEKERRTAYRVTLRWGFDELRLNDDGTAEWVDNRPAPPPQTDYSLCSYPVTHNGLQNAICNTTSIETQIQCLRAQQLQTLQSAQIQNMINSISPAPLPAYHTQCCITPYAISPYLSCGFYSS